MLGLRSVRICNGCVERVASLAGVDEALCSHCGGALGMESARFAAAMGAEECTSCRMNPPDFARAVAFGLYDSEMREMLLGLKFHGMRRVADQVLGQWMAEAVLQLKGQAAPELVVVPVPLFHERERERGFNQSLLLARAALQELFRSHSGWKLELRPEVLVRVRDTRPQYALGPRERQRNLKGAFRVSDKMMVAGREVLLIDDIFTTGATANACARVLLRAGAAKVWVATVARAQPESTRALEATVARWDMAPVRAREQQISFGNDNKVDKYRV